MVIRQIALSLSLSESSSSFNCHKKECNFFIHKSKFRVPFMEQQHDEQEDTMIRRALQEAKTWKHTTSRIDNDSNPVVIEKSRAPPSTYGTKTRQPSTTERREYVCHRCGKPGHLIQRCPTNGDCRFDKKVMKRGAGIPQSHLRMLSAEEAKLQNNVMQLPDGTFAVHRGVPELFDPLKINAIQNRDARALVPHHLVCVMCNKLLRSAMKIQSCCNTSFCYQCIITDYVESEVYCPLCKRSSPVSAIVIDQDAREQVMQFQSTL